MTKLRLAVTVTLMAACLQANAEAAPQKPNPEQQSLQDAAAQYNARQDKARNKVVCKMETLTGTHIRQKVCRTVATMKRDEDEAKRMLKDVKPIPPKGN